MSSSLFFSLPSLFIFCHAHKRMHVLDNTKYRLCSPWFWVQCTELHLRLWYLWHGVRYGDSLCCVRTDPFYKSVLLASKVTAELWSSFNWVPSFPSYWHQPITVHERHTGRATQRCGDRSHAVRDYNWLGGGLNEPRRQSCQTDEIRHWYG